ncbi:MAG TPA: hypothetical protein VKQ32_01290 [Polyangia bacterium]|nr:hypothetical protein [Polyangia bacterium]
MGKARAILAIAVVGLILLRPTIGDSKPARISAAEAAFRRHAAEFKRARRARIRDPWFSAHADVVADGRRTCAEIKRRLGRPDRIVLPAHLAALAGEIDGLDDPKGELLIYEEHTLDDIGPGWFALEITCHDGRATSLTTEMQAS